METQQGPSGGTGGSATYEIPFKQQLDAISVHANVVVDNIQFIFPGSSPSAGGGGGKTYPAFGIPPGATLVGIRGSYRDVVEAISFIFSDGTESPTYGTLTPPPAATQFVLTVPNGGTLLSVFGASGDYVNNIGLKYSTPNGA